jgi:hypothetical protein
MEQFNTVVNQNLGWIHEHKYVLPVLSLFLGMYAALARPKLPSFVAKLFENPVFRLVVISYIIYRGNKDPQLSLMIAAAFLITMHMINKQKIELFGELIEEECATDNYSEYCTAAREKRALIEQECATDEYSEYCIAAKEKRALIEEECATDNYSEYCTAARDRDRRRRPLR